MNAAAAAAPRVSVIMAVHNSETWLAEAIDSVLAQTCPDFELLIHDDGSTDGSPELLKAYVERDRRISVSTAPNAGPGAARNRAIERARGEFLAIMDADDVCYPDRFARQVAWLDAHPDIAVLGTHVRIIDDAGRPVHYVREPTDHAAIDARNMEGSTALVHPTVMMRRAAMQAVGGYDESFPVAEDTDLWLRMAERFQLANCPAVLLDYRFHSWSISAAMGGNLTNNMRARQLAARRRGIPEESIEIAQAWGWRPAPDRKSRSDFAVRWAWRARGAGFDDTARHYFLHAIRLWPFSLSAWRSLVSSILRDRGLLK